MKEMIFICFLGIIIFAFAIYAENNAVKAIMATPKAVMSWDHNNAHCTLYNLGTTEALVCSSMSGSVSVSSR